MYAIAFIFPSGRAAELALIFFAMPLAVAWGAWSRRWMMPLLAIAAGGSVVVAVRLQASADQLGLRWTGFIPCAGIGLGVWAVAFILTALIRRYRRLAIFPLVSQQPGLFAIIVPIYGMSVMAQEFLIRGYFFWRYQGLGSSGLIWAVNVAAFGWLHIVFRSWVSMALTTAAGVLFTALYMSYGNLPALCVVHFSLGLSIFGMGYGHHFHAGTAALAGGLRKAR